MTAAEIIHIGEGIKAAIKIRAVMIVLVAGFRHRSWFIKGEPAGRPRHLGVVVVAAISILS